MKKLSKIVHKSKASIAKILTVAMCVCMCFCIAVPCMATDGETTSATTPALNIDFEVTEMFTWAEMMINAMKPVMYITMGVGLAFLVLGAFQAIFSKSR